jgi:hypothetical protein
MMIIMSDARTINDYVTSARVISYTPRVKLQIVASLTIAIYNCNVFMVQAKDLYKVCFIKNIFEIFKTLNLTKYSHHY